MLMLLSFSFDCLQLVHDCVRFSFFVLLDVNAIQF